jgi:hypothetical protein
MTPEEFKERMQKLKDEHGDDEEQFHIGADALMETALEELGYQEGIEIWLSVCVWYA